MHSNIFAALVFRYLEYQLIICEVGNYVCMHVCVCVCVCVHPNAINNYSGVIWTQYGWLTKFYTFDTCH